jgi:ABC-type sugar transport system substrate-binding protein
MKENDLKRIGTLALATLLVAPCLSPSRVLAAGEPYSIGAILSESGPGASLGRPEADSVQLAVDEINKAGGVSGHPLKVTIVDDESNPTTAVNAVRSLLDQKVIAIVGPSLTQTSLAVSPIVDRRGRAYDLARFERPNHRAGCRSQVDLQSADHGHSHGPADSSLR